jgi:hypothetical protein
MIFRDPSLALAFCVVVVFFMLMGYFLFLFASRENRNEGPQFEGHWGGLGGGMSGWRISPSILFLVVAVVSGVMATDITISLINRRPLVAVEKYQSVVRLMAQSNVKGIQIYEEKGKVILHGEAPDEETKNRIWDQIKLVNPALDDVSAEITLAASPKH